jgi:hypothetical protein
MRGAVTNEWERRGEARGGMGGGTVVEYGKGPFAPLPALLWARMSSDGAVPGRYVEGGWWVGPPCVTTRTVRRCASELGGEWGVGGWGRAGGAPLTRGMLNAALSMGVYCPVSRGP